MKRVEIEWVDANEMHGWGVAEEVERDSLPIDHTTGYLFSEDDFKVIIVSTWSDYGSYLSRLAIPKGCIRSIKELRIK